MKKTVNNARKKLARKISPEKYPFVELNWATAESSHRNYMKVVHRRFKEAHGRPAESDEEAYAYDRKELKKILDKLGLEMQGGTELPKFD